MQTLNLIETPSSEFNAFRLYEKSTTQVEQRKLSLMERLQSCLTLESILDTFATEIADLIDVSGITFKKGTIITSSSHFKSGRKERLFELKLNNRFLGTLTYSLNKPMSLKSHAVLQSLHDYLLHPINNALRYQEALTLALQDGLTELGNRRSFDQQIKRAIHSANRHLTKVGLMVCDLDRFKEINDTYGHKIGDLVLTHFALALQSSIRDSDSCFRFGGDEFAIIVENASENSLVIIENRLKLAIAQDPLLAKYNVSSSIGATFMKRDDSEHTLFDRADTVLYQRKLERNRQLSIV
ncbi:GGDEF domain-containing protein [Thalassotalea fusca]